MKNDPVMGDLNFVKIKGEMFEPNLKLTVQPTGPRLDDGSIWTIHVGFDPEMTPENVAKFARTQAHPPSSSEWFNVTVLHGRITLDSETASFFLDFGKFGFEGPAKKIEAVLGASALGLGYEIIYQIMKSCVELSSWDCMTKERVFDEAKHLIWAPDRKSLKFFLDQRLAEQLSFNSKFHFEGAHQDYILFAEREVRI